MGQLVMVKRWRLREGCTETELLDLIRGSIVPHYRQLSGDVKLGLLRIRGTRSYLALQCWLDRAAWEAATQSDTYQEWFDRYVPILARWNELMEFEEEWEAEELPLDPASQ